MSSESIMKIIQNSQRGEERPQSTNQKYISLSEPKENEQIEK